jgi:hypothetical protein
LALQFLRKNMYCREFVDIVLNFLLFLKSRYECEVWCSRNLYSQVEIEELNNPFPEQFLLEISHALLLETKVKTKETYHPSNENGVSLYCCAQTEGGTERCRMYSTPLSIVNIIQRRQ